MGLIKEYADRAVQTDTDTVHSPYIDPAVVLAAPPVTRSTLAQEGHTGHHSSASTTQPAGSYGTFFVPQSPTSPILAPLVSRRLPKRKHARYDAVNRRIVSMPENRSDVLHNTHGNRIASMPDRIRPALEPSAEVYQSPPAAAGDSFGSYSGHYDHVRAFCTPSDVPQTPSPPSSPESLLIIAAGTQLPEEFLRRRYSPEPLIEEDEDWVSWANSPPRPIPALHGPLSLPYARCPSGAEGTIIEEPDNVAQMIWGLGPDDQSHHQVRAEDLENSQNNASRGPSQVPPRLQKKRAPATQQVSKLSRTSHASLAKPSPARSKCQAPDDKRSPTSQLPLNIEVRRDIDIVSGPPWNEEQSMPGNFVDDTDVFPFDDGRVLEWQLTRLRHALRTSLADMDSYATYPGRLEPVLPAALTPGLPQSYPRIFVEPRPNESISPTTRQPSIETAQHRQQQLYRQALQKQKSQIQNFLPTPPNSSSPQWSSRFSPYLTYCSTFSPELVGSTERLVPVSSQKYGPGTNASQCLRHVYDRHGHDNVTSLDMGANISLDKTPQILPNITSAPALRQSSTSASTLAKYTKQLQVLSPVAHFSPLQSISSNASLPLLPCTDESAGPFQTMYHSPAVATPPSPESPGTASRGSSYNGARSMAHPVQRRLSSVPEEDSAFLELTTSVSPSQLQSQVTTNNISSSCDGTMERQIRQSAVPEFEGISRMPSIAFHHETSPVKVRLPVTKEHNIREPTSGHHGHIREGHQHGHKKKHRYKKLKGPATTHEQATTREFVG